MGEMKEEDREGKGRERMNYPLYVGQGIIS
jgi:hypothetical protein